MPYLRASNVIFEKSKVSRLIIKGMCLLLKMSNTGTFSVVSSEINPVKANKFNHRLIRIDDNEALSKKSINQLV